MTSSLGSGKSECEYVTYGIGMVSPFMSLMLTSLLPQLWSLAYKADLSKTMQVLLAIAIWDMINDYLAGYMQDKQMLGKFFPKEKWGRRAPWYVTHLLPNAFAVGSLFWVPSSMKNPGEDDSAIYLWLGINGFFLRWCTTHCYTAYKGATVEIFPSSQDRLRMEFWLIVFGWTAGVFSVLSFGFMLNDLEEDDTCQSNSTSADITSASITSANITLLPSTVESSGSAGVYVGLFFFTSMITGFVCVPMMMTAKKEADPSKVSDSLLQFLVHAYSLKEAVIYYGVNIISDFTMGMNAACYGFFMTYVAKETKENVAMYSSIVGIAGMISQISMGAFLKWRWTKGDSPTKWSIRMKLIYAVLMPFWMGVRKEGYTAMTFIIGYIVSKNPYITPSSNLGLT